MLFNKILKTQFKFLKCITPIHFSLIIHILLIIIFFISSTLHTKHQNITTQALVVEMLPIDQETNLKIKTGTSENQTEKSFKLPSQSPKVPNIKKKSKQSSETNIIETPDKNAIYPQMKHKPSKIKPDSLQSTDAPIQKRKKKKESDDKEFSSMLKSIRKQNNNSALSITQNKDGLQGIGNMEYDIHKHNTQNIGDYIRSQFIDCWIVPIKIITLRNITVTVNITLNTDGSVNKVSSAHNIVDEDTKILLESAKRAVYRCSPIKGLEKFPYQLWKEMQITFDPRDTI